MDRREQADDDGVGTTTTDRGASASRGSNGRPAGPRGGRVARAPPPAVPPRAGGDGGPRRPRRAHEVKGGDAGETRRARPVRGPRRGAVLEAAPARASRRPQRRPTIWPRTPSPGAASSTTPGSSAARTPRPGRPSCPSSRPPGPWPARDLEGLGADRRRHHGARRQPGRCTAKTASQASERREEEWTLIVTPRRPVSRAGDPGERRRPSEGRAPGHALRAREARRGAGGVRGASRESPATLPPGRC